MCLWAEEAEISIDTARQAALHVHANFATELSQHPSANHVWLSKPLHSFGTFAIWQRVENSPVTQKKKALQALMVRAIGAIIGDAPFHLLHTSDAQSDSSEAGPASSAAGSPAQPSTTATATETAPRRSGRQHTPATEYWKSPLQPRAGLNEPPQTPLSTAFSSQRQRTLGEAEAGGIVCNPANWAMACHCSAIDTPC